MMDYSYLIDVLLFKSLDETNDVANDPYFKKLKEARINVKLIPPLQFVYNNLDDLTSALAAPDSLSGIIFVSPRSVFAVINCLTRLEESVLSAWNSKEIFVVGKTTGYLVTDRLKLNHKGSSSGSLNSLINNFILTDKYDKPLLMPCGNLHDRTDEGVLKNNNINVKYIYVYDTQPREDLDDHLSHLFSTRKAPKVLVFFSPSGVKAVLPHVPDLNEHNISFVAIGPKTELALIEASVKVAKTCLKPTEDDVYKAVMSIFNEQNVVNHQI